MTGKPHMKNWRKRSSTWQNNCQIEAVGNRGQSSVEDIARFCSLFDSGVHHGWTRIIFEPGLYRNLRMDLDELEGKKIPYVPPDLEKDIPHDIKRLFEEKTILRHETRRMTKDGRIIDVIMRAVLFSDPANKEAGELVILRDITREKRIARNNQAMLRISMALPQYPDLDELLNYISSEIKDLLGVEGGVVILLDEEKQEIFFRGVAYDDTATQKRVKEIRFSVDHADQVVAMKVIRTGEPVIVNDTSKIAKSYPLRDKKLGYETKNSFSGLKEQ